MPQFTNQTLILSISSEVLIRRGELSFPFAWLIYVKEEYDISSPIKNLLAMITPKWVLYMFPIAAGFTTAMLFYFADMCTGQTCIQTTFS